MTANHPTRTIAVLGAGVMGSAVLDAVLKAGQPAESSMVTTLDPVSRERWTERGVRVVDNPSAAREGDIVILAVKPADLPGVLDEIRDDLAPDALVVSLAAGVRLKTLHEHLPEGAAAIRVMPNTPALLGLGMLALTPGPGCRPDQIAEVEQLLSACGSVVVVPETQQDAVTGLSGSGPAYVFYLAEALIEAGVGEGIPRPVATELAVQTLYGAATMLRRSQTHPSLLREQVTSPGGTTAAGLRELDRAAVRAAVGAAVSAAAATSARLGRG